MSSSNSSGGGMGICGVLFIVFLVLKLTEVGSVAGWSWWWVTSPLWIPFVLALVLVFVAGVIKACER